MAQTKTEAKQHEPVGKSVSEVRRTSREEADRDTVPFWPYFVIKDLLALVVILVVFFAVVGFMPNYLGHPDNYVEANPLATPAHIVPEWYLLPFYAILRAIPDKFGGVIAMFGAIAVIFALPWLDTSKVRSTRYRPQAKLWFWIFLATCLVLGWCGAQLPDAQVIPGVPSFDLFDGKLNSYLWLTRIATLLYFVYFLVVLPLLGLMETPLPVPPTISEPVLSRPGGDGGDGGAYVNNAAGRPALAPAE